MLHDCYPLEIIQKLEALEKCGFNVEDIKDEIVERQNKSTRRSKAAAAPEPVSSPEESVSAVEEAYPVQDPEGFKEETIARLEALYFEDGGAAEVPGGEQKLIEDVELKGALGIHLVLEIRMHFLINRRFVGIETEVPRGEAVCNGVRGGSFSSFESAGSGRDRSGRRHG